MIKGPAGGATAGRSGARRGSRGVLLRHANGQKMAYARQETEGRKRGGGGGNRGGGDRSRRGKRPAACDNGKGDGKVREGGIGEGVAGAPSNEIKYQLSEGKKTARKRGEVRGRGAGAGDGLGGAGSTRGEHAGATRGARWAVGCSPLPTSSRRHDQKRPNPRSTARKAAPSAEGARATLSGGRRRWRGASSGGISPLSCTGLRRSSRRSVCSGEGTEIPLPRLAAARGGGAGAAKVVLGHLVLLHGQVRARHHQGAMGQGLAGPTAGRLATGKAPFSIVF